MAQVVEFVEPCAWKPRKDSKKEDAAGSKSARGSKKADETFEELKKSVLEFGASGKTRKEKLQMEENRLVQLGCAPRKKMKVPLPILQGMLNKKRKREKEKKIADREAEIVTVNASSKRRKKH